jgi:hypothetical protein
MINIFNVRYLALYLINNQNLKISCLQPIKTNEIRIFLKKSFFLAFAIFYLV